QHNPPPRARRQQEIEDMRYIDAFNHFFPKRIYELMLQSPAGQKDLGKRMRGIPALYDVEERRDSPHAFAEILLSCRRLQHQFIDALGKEMVERIDVTHVFNLLLSSSAGGRIVL